MLKPRYIEQLPDHMIELYSQLEMDIIADMARRIATYDFWIPSAEHQRKVLVEMGNFHSFTLEAIAAQSGRTRAELERLMEEAGEKALSFDTGVYRNHGLDPPPLAASPELQRVLRAGLQKTRGLFDNLSRTTANTASGQFERALDRAYMQVTSGAFDVNTVVRNAVKDLARQGVGAVEYPGRTESLEAAVRRAVVTGVNQTALQMQDELADEMGCDLVETTAHAGARPEHAVWQGKIFSRSGKHPKYPDFAKETGYGTGAGLGGWNCRHSFFPYFDGSPRAYTDKMLQDYEAKKYTYNGKKMTEYEATQIQRHIERQIRRWKRECTAMDAAGLDTGEAAAKVARWQSTQRDFIAQTGLKRQYDREQIGGAGNISGALKQKIQKKTAESRASDFFTIFGPEKGDAIQAKSIYKELQKSDIGKHTFDLIKERGIPVNVHYNLPPSANVLGKTDGYIIEIFARNTKTVKSTALTIIHETAHIEKAMGGGQWDEAYCFAQELKHTNPILTYSDLRAIIKEVKHLYPDLHWKGR